MQIYCRNRNACCETSYDLKFKKINLLCFKISRQKRAIKATEIAVAVILAYFMPRVASGQQINYTLSTINLSPLMDYSQLQQFNTPINPATINANAFGQSIANGDRALAIGAGSQAQNFSNTPANAQNTLIYDIGASATGNRSIAIGTGQGGQAELIHGGGGEDLH